MASEGTTQREIWLKVGGTSRLFRLNTGRGWISGLGPKGVVRLADGSVVIKAARSIALGFSAPNGDPVVGACDLPGWTTITITPEMVGHKVAVFTSIEAKRSKGGKPTEDQLNWATQVQNAGGIAGVANSGDAAASIITSWHAKFTN